MTFDRETREDIVKILKSHLGENSITNIDNTIADLGITLKNLKDYYGKEVIGVDKVRDYYTSLSNACSALLTFCKDRNLAALYNFINSEFVITEAV